jgi:signal transduction histidine kinase
MSDHETAIPHPNLPDPTRVRSYAQDLFARLQSLPDGQSCSEDAIRARPDLAEIVRTAITVAEEREGDLLAQAQRKVELEQILGKLIHESGSPLGVLRGCCESLRSECKSRGIRFAHDYLADMRSWCQLITDLLQGAQLELRCPEQLPLNPRRSSLQEIVETAIASVAPLLDARGFSATAIRRHGLESLPPLLLDATLMKYVIAQLLRNAIAHAYSDPGAFQVELKADRTDAAWHIYITSYGAALEPASVFAEGTPIARQHALGPGDGLGAAKRLVERHGGKLVLVNLHLPTTFKLSLP